MSKNANKVTTPRSEVAGFTAIQSPTWDFNKTTEEYQIRIAMDAAVAAPFIKKLEAMRDAHFDEILAENPKFKKVLKKMDVGSVEYDDEGEETGRVLIRFKQKAEITYKNKKGQEETFQKKVGLFDSKGKHIKEPVKIGSGSTVKVSFEPHPYFMQKDKEVGISFNRLLGVQLINLVEYEGDGVGSAEDMGFGAEDDEDGFEAGQYTSDQSGDDDDMGGEEDF